MRHALVSILLLAVAWFLAAPLRAADDPLEPGVVKKADKPDKAEKPAAKAGAKDPVDSAFTLPKSASRAVLRADQQQALKALRDQYEPKLRTALEAVEKASGDQEKTKAAKDVMKLRTEIQKGIMQILQSPDPTATNAPAQKPKGGHKGGRKRS